MPGGRTYGKLDSMTLIAQLGEPFAGGGGRVVLVNIVFAP